MTMRFLPFLLATLSVVPTALSAAEPEPETCAQVGAQIGALPPGNADLLRKMASRKDCAFSSADFYKAAYGDRPMAREAPRHRCANEEDDDD